MYSYNQGDLPRNSIDRDVHHEHTKRKETQKYLRETQKYPWESCYYRFECTTFTFLVIFMWRRPLNSAALATTTHRKPKRVSNKTGTQVRAKMTNKYRIKMIQRELYNVRNLPGGRNRKERERIL